MPDLQQHISEFQLKVEGNLVTVDNIARLELVSALNRPALVTLSIHDPGDPANGWSVSDDAKWKIGKALEVAIGAGDSQATPVFKGEITSVSFEAEAGLNYLTVRAHDKLQRMFHGAKFKTFADSKHSDVMSQVISNSGLSASVDSLSVEHPFVVQADLSDGEMLARLAAENGFVFYMRNDTVHCTRPAWSGSGPTLNYGEELQRFRVTQSSEAVATKVKVTAWDPQTKAAIVAEQTTVKTNGAALTKEVAEEFKSYASEAPLQITGIGAPDQSGAQALADAVADRLGDTGRTAEGLTLQCPELLAGAVIDIQKVPTAFEGKYFVTEARHVMAAGSYEIEFRCSGALDLSLSALGRPSTSPSPAQPLHHPQALTVLPAVVTDTMFSEMQQGTLPSVKVKIPYLDDASSMHWMRIVCPGTGKNFSSMFLPEVGDEVLAVFEGGDLQRGYVLGGLYNGEDIPLEPFDADVDAGEGHLKRGFASTNKQHVLLWDKSGEEHIDILGKEKVVLADKESQQVMLDATNKKILVKAGENSFEIDASANKITIKSNGEMAFEAMNNISIKSTSGKISIEASAGDLEMKGMNVKAEANAKIEVKGNAGANLESPAITVVKGSLVQIN